MQPHSNPICKESNYSQTEYIIGYDSTCSKLIWVYILCD